MYDNEQLERSRFYFTLLQLLRIFSEWIANDMASSKLAFEKHNAVTLSDMIFFGLWNDYIETSDIVNAINIIKRNWHVVLALHEKEGQALLDRIARDIQTVESLRDGVSRPNHLDCQINTKQSQSSSTHSLSERPLKAPNSTGFSSSLQ